MIAAKNSYEENGSGHGRGDPVDDAARGRRSLKGAAGCADSLPAGSAVPGTEEDTESARAAGPEESATPPRTATSRRDLRCRGLRRMRSLQGMRGQQSPAESAESAKLNRLGNAGQELRAAASLRDQGCLKLRSLHCPKDRAAPEESAGAKGFAELAEVPGSAPQTDSDGHKSCGAGRIGNATKNSDVPAGSAVPGTEEDAESARDAGAAERSAAQAGTAGAEGAEGPGRAPPKAGSSVPTEGGAPAEYATPKRSAAPGAATGSVGRRP